MKSGERYEPGITLVKKPRQNPEHNKSKSLPRKAFERGAPYPLSYGTAKRHTH